MVQEVGRPLVTTGRIRSLTKPKLFTEARARGLLGEFVAIMDSQIDDALKIMRTEPPPKIDSKYVRTHTYQDSWKPDGAIRQTREGLVGSISSDAVDPYGSHYTELVGGDEQGEGQLEMHSDTGWPLLAEALRGEAGRSFSSRIRKAIKEFLK